MYRPLLCAVLSVAILSGAGCGDSAEDPTPTVPTLPEITEPPFTGTLTINGGATQPFTTTTAGTVTAILDSLEPSAPSLAIGVSLGTWNGTSCQWITANDQTGVGSGVAAYANGPGQLCARVYDVGRLTEAVTFKLTIKHY